MQNLRPRRAEAKVYTIEAKDNTIEAKAKDFTNLSSRTPLRPRTSLRTTSLPGTVTKNLHYEITDHLPIFLALTSLQTLKEPSNDLFQSLKNFNPNAYIDDLQFS